MSRSRVRLQDIADSTGFSMNTVSLALRDSPRIKEETRKLILREAERVNYFPNRIARSLASQASHTVGLIMTDVMNPTLTLAARTIERKLSLAGYGMMFAASDSLLANEKKALEWFQSYLVDGILIYPADHTRLDHIRAASSSGIPVLLLANLPESGLDVVAVDDHSGARRVVRYLLSQGHRRIAVIDGGHVNHSSEKYEGACEAVCDSGLARDTLAVVHPTGNSAAQGYEAMERVTGLMPSATALFASTDSLAIGALRWCQTHDVSVPGDLAVVGYDNTEASEYCSLPLTTVNYAADQVSSLAVDRILSMIDSTTTDEAPIVEKIVPELIVRSTA